MSQEAKTGFRLAVMELLVDMGTPYSPENVEAREEVIWPARWHMDKCAPASMTDYTREVTPYARAAKQEVIEETDYDVRAAITCKCGQVENIVFVTAEIAMNLSLDAMLED